tara:strand:+ start:527 stop:853 length:327 start_codon:yes stop_codon:yes gene_type:complete
MKTEYNLKIGEKRDFLKRRGLTEREINRILGRPKAATSRLIVSEEINKTIARQYDYVQKTLLIPVDVFLVLKDMARNKSCSVQDIMLSIVEFELEYSIIESFKAYEGI